MVDLLVIVLEKTKSRVDFTKRLIEVVVKISQDVKSQFLEFSLESLSNLQRSICEKQSKLLKSIQEFVSCSWVDKEIKDIEFVITVSARGIGIFFNVISRDSDPKKLMNIS